MMSNSDTTATTFRCLGCHKIKDKRLRARGKKVCNRCNERIQAEGIKVYGQYAYVPCPTPGCDIRHKVSLNYRLSEQFNPALTCPQCAPARQSEARSQAMAVLQKPASAGAVIRMNGCELHRTAHGRCNMPDPEPCCRHYLECLDAVSSRNWPGWMAVKAEESTPQEA